VTWKVYTLDANGILNSQPVVTKSISRFETVFGQSLDGDAVTGIDPSKIVQSTWTQDQDVALEAGTDAVYVRSKGALIQVTDGNGGSVSFDYTEETDGGSSSSHVVASEEDGANILMAVEYATTVGTDTSKSWVVHTLTVEGTGADAYAKIDWSKADVTSDMTSYISKFGQNFTQDVVTTVGA
jgi:hypothetical protein